MDKITILASQYITRCGKTQNVTQILELCSNIPKIISNCQRKRGVHLKNSYLFIFKDLPPKKWHKHIPNIGQRTMKQGRDSTITAPC